MKSFTRLFIITFLICIPIYYIYAQTASILPPAETQFFDANGNPLSGGTVDFYIPNTFTRKTTWQDAAETIPNANPVILDAAGKALILGSGSYRQIIKDSLGNLIWDQVTTAPLPSSGATLTGDGNAVGTIKPYIGLVAPAQYLFANGQNISRTTYSALIGVMTQVSNVVCQSGNPTITGLSDTTQIPNGAAVELACVPSGTTVLSTTSTTVTLSMNSTINGNATATFFPFGNGDGVTTFTLPDMRGVYLAGRNNMGGSAGTKLSTTFFSSANPNALGAIGGAQSHTMTVAELVAHNHTVSITDPGHTHTVGIGTNNIFQNGGATPAEIATGTTTSSTNTTGITATTANNGTGNAFTIVPPTMTVNYVIKVLPDTSISTSNVVTSLGGLTGPIACGTNITCSGTTIFVNTTGGGTVANASTGQLGYYASNGTTISGNTNANITNGALTLGTANTTLGSLILEGSTSGAVTLTPQAVAGTPTVTYGTNSGTPAVTASAPIVLNSGTGNLTLNAIANANLANMNANTIKANNTGGATTPSDLTAGQLGAMLCVPNTQIFISGAAQTYTTPTCNGITATWLELHLQGGGGGGGGSGTTATSASNGNTSSFGALTANGGGGGTNSGVNGESGAGGTCSGSLGTQQNFVGGMGEVINNAASTSGGYGAASYYGGAGANGITNAVGQAAAANTGAGGGGAGMGAAGAGPGAGGGSGCHIWSIVTAPAATALYTVGAAAAGGTAGTSGQNGGQGAAGLIIATAHWQ